MREQSIYFWPGLIPVISGMCWLLAGLQHGWGLALSLIPGLVHVGAGVGLLLWPGDRRIPQFLAVSCLLALFLIVPAVIVFGGSWMLVLVLLAMASFVVSGYAALHHEPQIADIPALRITLGLALWVALDDALLGYFTLSARIPAGVRARRMSAECEQVRACNLSRVPLVFHREPTNLQGLRVKSRRSLGHTFEHLSFDSGYRPWEGDPGSLQWTENIRNRRAHAWVVQHPGPPRPWLVCIHGYRMGLPWMDFGLFRPRWLHQYLGLNLLLPVLPLHGPRRAGIRSGDGYMDGDFPNFIHAEAQAMHDIRSQIRWLRDDRSAPAVGVLGYSLGGYNAALLACLEQDLACVIAGIPMTDITYTLWRHMPMLQLRYLDSLGLTEETARDALRLVSPLAMPLKVARRYIFAGLADRLIPPQQVLNLARHWQLDDVAWYCGTHLSFGTEAIVSKLILRALRESGLVPA